MLEKYQQEMTALKEVDPEVKKEPVTYAETSYVECKEKLSEGYSNGKIRLLLLSHSKCS